MQIFVSIALLALVVGADAFWKDKTDTGSPPWALPAESKAVHDLRKAEELMQQPRTEADTWQAYKVYTTASEQAPTDPDLKFKAAEALLAYLRRKSTGNALRIDGLVSDSKPNRKLWAEHAPEALALLDDSKAAFGSQGKWHFLHAEAFMYKSCSKSVARAAVTGDAFTFKKNAQPLLTKHLDTGDGVGHIFMGAFYLGAPWPVFNQKKGRDHFQAAKAHCPVSRRNRYYCGLEALRRGSLNEARSEFEAAVANESPSVEEQDISKFLLQQSQAALAQIAEQEAQNRQ